MGTQTTGLRERKNARTQAAIVRAALELSLEVGFDRATVAQIAERADVSPRTVHTWFGSKEDIVVGPASDASLERLAEALEGGEGTTIERVAQWVRDEGVLRTEPDEVERLRHRLLIADPHLRVVRRARLDAVERLIAGAVVREVGLPPDSVAARALAAAMVTTLMELEERFATGREGLTEQAADTLLMITAALDALRSRSR